MAGKTRKARRHHDEAAAGRTVQGQGVKIADAVRQIRVTRQTYCRRWREYGGMSRDQLKRSKELEQENARLRRAISDLTLDKLIPSEAARPNY